MLSNSNAARNKYNLIISFITIPPNQVLQHVKLLQLLLILVLLLINHHPLEKSFYALIAKSRNFMKVSHHS